MSGLFPTPTSGGGQGPEADRPTTLDPTLDLRTARQRWEVRSAQWRARALAEAIFGGTVRVRLSGAGIGASARGGVRFRGMLHLEVPFEELELHRWRERVFTACAGRDPVLGRVPVIYVFEPAVRT